MESSLSSAIQHASSSLTIAKPRDSPPNPVKGLMTEYLLNLETTKSAYKAATRHPFLTAAGRGTLDPSILKSWLAQDRLYALTYTRFISNLLSRIPIPTSADRPKTLEWRVLSTLIDCLTNIRTELSMFEDVAKEENWDADKLFGETRMNDATREYEALFASVGFSKIGYAQGGPLGIWRGMILLWATERCYHQAWSHARTELERTNDEKGGEKRDDVLTRSLIPNWSSPQFGEFVQQIADLVDEMGTKADEVDVKEAEDVWRSVLLVEAKFWPDIEASWD